MPARFKYSQETQIGILFLLSRKILLTIWWLDQAPSCLFHHMSCPANLTWDFYDGQLRRSQEEEAQARARYLAGLSQATLERLQRKLIDLEARARTAQADLVSAKETLQQTQVYLRVAKAAVAAGTGTSLDVHTAELGVDQSRIAVERALFAMALARAEMSLVSGIAQERSGGAS